jgi:hypothetical protein
VRIRIRNLIASPVSLPGPLPRLLVNDDITTEIEPRDFDLIRSALDTLRDNSIIDVTLEIGGSIDNDFTFDDTLGRISYRNSQLAPTGGSAILAWGASGVTATTAVRYLWPFHSDSIATTTAIPFFSPRNGTIRRMYISIVNANGNGNRVTYTLRINSVDTNLKVTMPSDVTSGQNIIDEVIVFAGDKLDIEVTKPDGIIGNDHFDIVLTVEMLGEFTGP